MLRIACLVAMLLSPAVARGQDSTLRLAKFDIDVTPPVGFMMAYDRVKRVEELGLRCRGIVLLGSDKPVVVCAVDWIGIGNEAHDAFRDTIAKAAGTTRERVAVQTLHQHDAPRCDFTAERLLHEAGASDLGAHEGSFAREVLKRLSAAIKESLPTATKVTHAAIGEADVQDVASNRRIQDETGKVVKTRYTTCRDPKMRALPDGIIDPELTTVSFWNDKMPLAVLSYYACHPQSYYRTGVPSPDFPGIARFIRGQDVPDVLHVHFNGAGGNIGAGKYNDGAKENRLILARRVADGMKRSFESAEKFPITANDVGWFVAPVAMPLGKHLVVKDLRENLPHWKSKDYWGSPEQLAWALRCESGHKVDLSCLKVGKARILHMPGELFVEYQLAAKKLRPDLHVAMAAYGDYGPGYIGTDESYGQGGYETSERASKVAKGVEKVLMEGVQQLLDDADAIVGNFKKELPRIAPTEPAEAMNKFRITDGYRIELVASEPLIGSPVAIEWDATGKMYVCEMRGYSEDRDDKISTIALLSDEDNDGVYDRRDEFASGLHWPTAIFPYDGGLFVGDAPDLFYMKDTDGDGKADIKKTVLTGFGVSNVQGLMNSMRWGLDNVIHIACSSVGGKIKIVGSDGSPKNIRGRDLAFNPKTYEFTATSGAAQHGMCFDDWGRKFTSANSNHIMQVMYEDHHVARNEYLAAPSARISIAADGPQAEVYRNSPVEPWRIVRTRLRVAGTVKGPVEGGGRAAGYFTGATGVTIYRGDAWPENHKGLAIVGDVGSNLIHRKKLTPKGIQFVAHRIDDHREFVTSSDIWFRPCQFANAPDGSLHVIDMYREVIEHPKSLPPDIKKHLDLTSGRDRGRIYRIVPHDFEFRSTPNLRSASTNQLVATLEHPNAWHRETASRLIFERQDISARKPLKDLVRNSTQPLARMHAMYALDGMRSLGSQTIFVALNDSHPQVRRHAIRLAERTGVADTIADELIALADDPSHEVRVQLAYAMGGLYHSKWNETIGKIIRHDPADTYTQVAVQSSLAASASGLFSDLISDHQFRSRGGGAFLSAMAKQIVQQEIESDTLEAVEALSSVEATDASFMLPIIGQFLDGRNKKGTVIARLAKSGRLNPLSKTSEKLASTLIETATNRDLNVDQRVQAIRALEHARFSQFGQRIAKLINASESDTIQLASIGVLGRFNEQLVSETLLDAWPSFSPRLRSTATDTMFSRAERTLALFDAVDAGKIGASNLQVARLKTLLKSRNKDVASRAKAFLQTRNTGPRTDVVAAYQSTLKMNGDAKRGRNVFKKSCAACHKVQGVGHELGPNLATIKSRGAETILVNVLDPSREVNPEFVNYVVLTDDGRSLTGMITAESAGSITLTRAEGATDTILRSNIEQIQSTGVSIMPNGLEETVSKQDMADLIEYLMTAS